MDYHLKRLLAYNHKTRDRQLGKIELFCIDQLKQYVHTENEYARNVNGLLSHLWAMGILDGGGDINDVMERLKNYWRSRFTIQCLVLAHPEHIDWWRLLITYLDNH